MIKYGMINRPEILNALENGCDDEELVAMCVDDKRVLVEYDEHDRGLARAAQFRAYRRARRRALFGL